MIFTTEIFKPNWVATLHEKNRCNLLLQNRSFTNNYIPLHQMNQKMQLTKAPLLKPKTTTVLIVFEGNSVLPPNSLMVADTGLGLSTECSL